MDAPAERQFALYAQVAACAVLFRSEFSILFHGVGHSNVTWSTWLPIAGALAVFFRPSDLRSLLALYLGVVADITNILPEAPNHWLLTGVVGLSWWAAAASAGLAGGRLPSGGALLRRVQPAFRPAIALFYLFTGLWKLNAGFADPIYSCGPRSWERLVVQFPSLPGGTDVAPAVIRFTWVLEVGGPVLMMLLATRRPMVAFFAFFHLVLSLDLAQNYQNFSWAMYPLLLLFFEPEAVETAAERWSLDGVFSVVKQGTLAMFTALVALAWFQPANWYNLRWTFSVALGGALVLGLCAVAAVPRVASPAVRRMRVAWLFAGLVFLNGISPILGFKNRNAWQMYSNVRIEPDVTNHYLFPRSLDLLGLQSDTVEVVAIDHPGLAAEYVGSGLKLTWWDFRSMLALYPEVHVTWRRAGEEHTARSRDAVLTPPPRILRMFIWFRPVGEQVARQCVW